MTLGSTNNIQVFIRMEVIDTWEWQKNPSLILPFGGWLTFNSSSRTAGIVTYGTKEHVTPTQNSACLINRHNAPVETKWLPPS